MDPDAPTPTPPSAGPPAASSPDSPGDAAGGSAGDSAGDLAGDFAGGFAADSAGERLSRGSAGGAAGGAASQERRLAAALAAARRRTDELFALLRPEALYERAVAERHRFIFYLGHLEAFDWNLCRGQLALGDGSELDRLFAFGIDPDRSCPDALPCDQAADWPRADAVYAYLEERRALFDRHHQALPAQLLHVAIEHRLMHAETLCYLMHWLPLGHKRLLAPPQPDARPAPEPTTVAVPAGAATLGRRRGFGWCNEFAEHAVAVPAFAIDKYKVTNAQYLRFVRDGGPVPLFWRQTDSGFMLRCMFGEIPLPPSWPVYATHEEASAYARWAGRALPSEAQFHRAAFAPRAPQTGEREYPWGDEAPRPACGNFDFQHWDPRPVDATPDGDSALGVAQLIGNGWEWTGTTFGPFPGFERFPFYPGYSADFFDGQHFVMKGGSPRTASCFLRRSFRNWFRPNYRYVYAGFRCVDR